MEGVQQGKKGRAVMPKGPEMGGFLARGTKPLPTS